MAADFQTEQLKEKLELLDGSRGRDRNAAAIRIRDMEAILNYAQKLKSAKAAGATPTKAEFDALVSDVTTIHKALLALSAAIQAKLAS